MVKLDPTDTFHCSAGLTWGGGHRYLDTGSQKFAKYPKKKYPKVSKSIQNYNIFVSFFVDQSHPLNQLRTSSLEF